MARGRERGELLSKRGVEQGGRLRALERGKDGVEEELESKANILSNECVRGGSASQP